MHEKLLLCAPLALTLLVACKEEAEQQPELPAIGGVYDMTVDFSSYQTFDVVEPDKVPAEEPAPQSYSEANRIAVIQSIIREMEARGYVRDPNQPDLLITPMVRLEDVEVVVQEAWYDYYYGWYWGYSYPWYDEDVVVLEAGTLIIDAVDVGTQEAMDDDQLVFRGYVMALLPSPPTDVSMQISEAITDIFEYWPAESEGEAPQ